MQLMVTLRLLTVLSCALLAQGEDFAARFAEIRDTATPGELYRFLYALPKGGDIHHHGGLSFPAESLLREALQERAAHGYGFYTRIAVRPCATTQRAPILWLTVLESTWKQLSPCEREDFVALESLNTDQRRAWVSALVLDQAGEGRNEFFENIVTRVQDMLRDPWLSLNLLVEIMGQYGREGQRYLETQFATIRWLRPDGQPISPEDGYRMLRERLAQPDARASGVTVRFQTTAIRFQPDAEQQLERLFAWTAAHRELFVGVNLAGREDNDKGHILRFRETLRRLRRRYADIPLSLHAGEVDLPGTQVRDTLAVGAHRIGHGLNLITDPETMFALRNGRYLIEINLISNRLLEYTALDEHPFPEYLRLGIPVCLNTDDAMVWDSTLTDEYFEAARRFRLTWEEVVRMGRHSLEFAFVEATEKQRLLREYDAAVLAFEKKMSVANWREAIPKSSVPISGYAKRHLGLQ
jgi:adenosine deaminase CECR1